MKIGIIHVMPAMENVPEDEMVKAWDGLLRQSMNQVKKDTEIVFQISRPGLPEKAVTFPLN